MSRVTLPQGQSLRQIAERLGVAADELARRAGLHDVEAPLTVARVIELPDGFLRMQPKGAQGRDAAVIAPQLAGMNMWMALDIEQKRTRLAGGMHAQPAHEHELEALDEARRTFMRFEADSNELAITLFHDLTATHSVQVRAAAFALEGCAYALRNLMFGEEIERARLQSLSAAKAALLADPKHPDSHLAMALGLRTGGDVEAARDELETAVHQHEEAPWCWAELARLDRLCGAFDDAREGAAFALELDPTCLFALEVAAELSFDEAKLQAALELWQRAALAVPTYAWAHVGAARTLVAMDALDEARAAADAARELANTEKHRAALERALAEVFVC